MTTCRNGHPRSSESTYSRKDGRIECRVCKNAFKRARTATKTSPRVVPPTCRNGHPKTAWGRCAECRAAGLPRVTRSRHLEQAPDGLEDLYGPVPLRVKDTEWFDQVIVDRAMSYTPTGRQPHRLEIDAIVSRIRPYHEITRIAEACGVEDQTVCGWIADREGVSA